MIRMTQDKETPTTKMPSEMLTAHLLALLKNWSGYGYELAKKLEEAGYGGFNSGTLYRTLRQMEKTGLISSLWDTSSDGPARRIYSLTKTGSLFLNNWITLLDMHKATLNNFIKIAEMATEPTDNSSNGKGTDIES
jgi:poly-beta-hydroxybutyrate-responsive repressor